MKEDYQKGLKKVKQDHEKQKEPEISDQSLIRLLLNLGSVERKRKNYKNLNISRTKRPFQMKFFIVFEGLSLGGKINNSGQKL